MPEADLARLAPLLGRRRSWWLREALAADPGEPCPPLAGSAAADVVIVGGGFTGLWTAWHLLEAAPGIRVAILERDIVGGGASGRNGGFLTSLWDSLPALVRNFGEGPGLATALALDSVPAEIGAWCRSQAVDAWFVPGGTLLAPTSDAQVGGFDAAPRLAARLGYGDRFIALTSDEVRARCASPTFGPGYLVPADASIQPARPARGLRRVLLERGVRIHEATRVRRLRRLRPGPSIRVETEGGALTARRVVLALNAWAAAARPFGARLVTWSSYVVLTEPIPDCLAELGWTGGEAISDARFTNHYFRTTVDGRIAFGGGGGRAGYGGRLGDWVTRDLDSVGLAARGFRRVFPMLADVALEDAWGGPIDIAPNHLPTFGTLPGGVVHFGHGYSGTGVGPSHLGGGILAALALDRRDDPVLELPLVGSRPRRFPPEPFRYAGARIVREAIVAAEQAEDLGGRANPVLRALTRVPRRMGYDLGPD